MVKIATPVVAVVPLMVVVLFDLNITSRLSLTCGVGCSEYELSTVVASAAVRQSNRASLETPIIW
jgi:hypothetical protein